MESPAHSLGSSRLAINPVIYDAIGTRLANQELSARRAASVAGILVRYFGVPPRNLVTEGYGEDYLKIPTDGPSRENRRVTIRNITPLLGR